VRIEATCPWCHERWLGGMEGLDKKMVRCRCGARCWITHDPNPEDGHLQLWEALVNPPSPMGLVGRARYEEDVEFQEVPLPIREANPMAADHVWRAAWAKRRVFLLTCPIRQAEYEVASKQLECPGCGRGITGPVQQGETPHAIRPA